MKTAMILVSTLSLVAVSFVALPVAADPGPFGPNNFGLCTAWANNENGRENGNADEAPPFQSLQQQAEDANQTVAEWCAENAPHPGGNGNGNGNGNGGEGGNGNRP